jgi:hypothetical protein
MGNPNKIWEIRIEIRTNQIKIRENKTKNNLLAKSKQKSILFGEKTAFCLGCSLLLFGFRCFHV